MFLLLPLSFQCPREFVIPEVVFADMLSARVADPQVSHYGFGDPQGQMLLLFPLSFQCPRGFVIPELLVADMLSARVTDPLS